MGEGSVEDLPDVCHGVDAHRGALEHGAEDEREKDERQVRSRKHDNRAHFELTHVPPHSNTHTHT